MKMFEPLEEKILRDHPSYIDLSLHQKDILKAYCDDEATYQVLRDLLFLKAQVVHPKVPDAVKENLDRIFDETFESSKGTAFAPRRFALYVLAIAASLGLFLLIKEVFFSSTQEKVIIAKQVTNPKLMNPPKGKKVIVSTEEPTVVKGENAHQLPAEQKKIVQEIPTPTEPMGVEMEWNTPSPSPSLPPSEDLSYTWSVPGVVDKSLSDPYQGDARDDVAKENLSVLATQPAGVGKKSIAMGKKVQKPKQNNLVDTQEMLKVIKPLY
jgi:hypothetical protein